MLVRVWGNGRTHIRLLRAQTVTFLEGTWHMFTLMEKQLYWWASLLRKYRRSVQKYVNENVKGFTDYKSRTLRQSIMDWFTIFIEQPCSLQLRISSSTSMYWCGKCPRQIGAQGENRLGKRYMWLLVCWGGGEWEEDCILTHTYIYTYRYIHTHTHDLHMHFKVLRRI